MGHHVDLIYPPAKLIPDFYVPMCIDRDAIIAHWRQSLPRSVNIDVFPQHDFFRIRENSIVQVSIRIPIIPQVLQCYYRQLPPSENPSSRSAFNARTGQHSDDRIREEHSIVQVSIRIPIISLCRSAFDHTSSCFNVTTANYRSSENIKQCHAFNFEQVMHLG